MTHTNFFLGPDDAHRPRGPDPHISQVLVHEAHATRCDTSRSLPISRPSAGAAVQPCSPTGAPRAPPCPSAAATSEPPRARQSAVPRRPLLGQLLADPFVGCALLRCSGRLRWSAEAAAASTGRLRARGRRAHKRVLAASGGREIAILCGRKLGDRGPGNLSAGRMACNRSASGPGGPAVGPFAPEPERRCLT